MDYRFKEELLLLSAKTLVDVKPADKDGYFYLNGELYDTTTDALTILDNNNDSSWFGVMELPKYEFFTLNSEGDKTHIHTHHEDLSYSITFMSCEHKGEPLLFVHKISFNNERQHDVLRKLEGYQQDGCTKVYCILSERLDHRIPAPYKEQMMDLQDKLFKARKKLDEIINSYGFRVGNLTIHLGDNSIGIDGCDKDVCHKVLDLARIKAENEINNINDDIDFFSKKR